MERQPALTSSTPAIEAASTRVDIEWREALPPEVLASLSQSEVNRQTIIRDIISSEQQYIKDLDFVEEVFIRLLRNTDRSVIQDGVGEFIKEVFGNILNLRECNRCLLEAIYVRQREQGENISRIGDIFLNAATNFRFDYLTYIGQTPRAEKRWKDEMENNGAFRGFLELCSHHPDNTNKVGFEHLLNRPSEHLYHYTFVFEAIRMETAEGNPDVELLKEAVEAMRNLQDIAHLKAFQTAMGEGPTGNFQWHDLVSERVRDGIEKQEAKRQALVFELIRGEMAYVKDLENIEHLYVQPLRSKDPPVIPHERLETFVRDVFCNVGELHMHHRRLLDRLFKIQGEEHPVISSIAIPMYDAALNFRDAYLKYLLNCPLAADRVDNEKADNQEFQYFVSDCGGHPNAHGLDMKSFIRSPALRLLRYELLLQGILKDTPTGHEDLETIPAILNIIKVLRNETEPGVMPADQKAELRRYNANLIFKPGEYVDMDLLNENRSLIYTGKFLRQSETRFWWDRWTELFALLFDNYLVITKPEEKDGITKYRVYWRPIPLDLLTLIKFNDPPTQRDGKLLALGGQKETGGQNRGVTFLSSGAGPAVNDTRAVYPCTIGRKGEWLYHYTLFAESSQARLEWEAELEGAIMLRKVSEKVFEVADRFIILALPENEKSSWDDGRGSTGEATCSVSFAATDGRPLVAIGCAEGVWVGLRHYSQPMRKVLNLRKVTRCAALEDFGIFLVLADGSLSAYRIEELCPSPGTVNDSQTRQELCESFDVELFTTGNICGRTFVVYWTWNGVFRVLELDTEKISGIAKHSIGSGPDSQPRRPNWFHVYHDFFFTSYPYDLLFLEGRIVILSKEGFTIMDLLDLKSVPIPRKEGPRSEEFTKRSGPRRPVDMFRSKKDEFLLCYDEFGLYVDEAGNPSRHMGTVEWERSAEQAACHPPYIFLFSVYLIEIRHVETGRLVQIISGEHIKCIWDGRGVNQSQDISGGSWDEAVFREPRVHVAMDVESPRPDRREARIRHVFELVPSALLSSPKSLAPPRHASYLKKSNPSHVNPYSAGSVGKIGHPTQMAAGNWSTISPLHVREERGGAGTHNGTPLTTIHTTPGSSIPVDSNAFVWKILTSHSSVPPHEVISLIEAIFTSKGEIKTIGDLRGDDAQTFIDTIHEALDLPGLPPRLRGKCVSALCRICGRQALLPRSLQIPICYNRSDTPLCHGGFADVWKGEYKGCHVAVKVLRVYSTSDLGKITRRFCKEVVTWNALSHPNVLPLLGIITDNNQFAMVSEWMASGNINEFIKANREVDPFELLKEVTSGLIYIHDQGMIHGDLKGANILIDKDRHARLADFGLLTIVSDPTNFSASSSAFAGGTVRWMSPELLHPELFGFDYGHPTKESDCYALGMVIYEVLAGQSPFMPWKEHIVMMKVTGGERLERPEGIIGTWFTDELWEMLNLCWETRDQDRPSIEVVRECLGHVSSTWKPLPPQVNEGTKKDEDVWDLADLSELVHRNP